MKTVGKKPMSLFGGFFGPASVPSTYRTCYGLTSQKWNLPLKWNTYFECICLLLLLFSIGYREF